MYEKSAQIYDLLYTGVGLKDYATEAELLHQIISDAYPNARTLLDVGCGTGAHLAQLRQWYQVEGIDISPEMLAVARTRLPGVPLRLADMRQLALGRTFDAVICLFSSIGYITDPDELRSTIDRLAAHVGPGGVLILDGWVRPEEWDDSYRGGPDVAKDETTTVVRLSFTRRVGNITELDMHHLVRSEDGIEYFAESHRLALTPTDQYVTLIEQAGLKATVLPDFMPGRDRIVGTRT